MTDPWDERYIYLHEWVDFYGKCIVNIAYVRNFQQRVTNKKSHFTLQSNEHLPDEIVVTSKSDQNLTQVHPPKPNEPSPQVFHTSNSRYKKKFH